MFCLPLSNGMFLVPRFTSNALLCLSWLKLEVPTEKFENDFSAKLPFHNAYSRMTCLLFVQQLKSGRSNYIKLFAIVFIYTLQALMEKGKVTLFKIGSSVCL